MARQTLKERIQDVATRTNDAFSHDRYGEREWLECTKYLMIDRKLSDRQAEAVLRSKLMRWAADRANGMPPKVQHLREWMADNEKHASTRAIEQLIIQTPQLN